MAMSMTVARRAHGNGTARAPEPETSVALPGRAADLARAVAALSGRTSAAGVTTVLVTGQPGSGRSAMLADILEQAEGPASSRRIVTASAADRRAKFALLSDTMRCLPVCGDETVERSRRALDRALAGDASDIGVVRHAFLGLTEALRDLGPSALYVDDFHLAGTGSAAILAAVLRQPGRHRLTLVASATSVTACDPVLIDALDRLDRAGALSVVELKPLEDAAVAALVRTALGEPAGDDVVSRVARFTGSNLYLLHELLQEPTTRRALGQAATDDAGGEPSLPPTGRARVIRRIFGTWDRPLDVAMAMAFLEGDSADRLPVIGALLGRSGDDVASTVEALVDDQILISDAIGAHIFAHPMVARVLADSISATRRRLWHKRAILYLSERCTCDAALFDLARHTAAVATSGDTRAIRVLCQAADRVCDTAPDRAVEWYRAALRLMMEVSPQRAHVQARLARAYYMTGDSTSAIDAGRIALGAMRRGRDRARALRVVSEASVWGETALELIEGERRRDDLSLLALSSHLFARTGRIDDAVAALTTVESSLVAADPHHELRCLTHLAHTYGLLARTGTMLATIRRILRLAATQPGCARVTGYINSSYLLALHGSPMAGETLARARELVDGSGRDVGRRELSLATAVHAFQVGDWDRALSTVGEVAPEFSAGTDQSGLAVIESIKAEILSHRGRLPPVRTMPFTAGECPAAAGLRAWAVAGIELAAGDPASARAGLEASLSTVHVPKFRHFLLTRLAEAELRANRPEAAVGHLTEVLPTSVDEATSLIALEAVRLHGRVRGDVDMLTTVLDAAQRRDAELLRAVTLFDLGSCGHRAAETLREAYAAFHRLGAHPLRRQTAGELTKLGLKAPRYRGSRQGPLTDAELEVGRLVQQGRRNREIALALSMSVKTVEAYLTRIYAKINCSSRLELARVLDELDHGER